MSNWKEKIIENAKQVQLKEHDNMTAEFPKDMKSFEQLMGFFINNYIEPLAEELIKINKDFYSIDQTKNGFIIKIIDKILYLEIYEKDTLFFGKKLDDGQIDMFFFVTMDGILAAGRNNVYFSNLTPEHLNKVMDTFSE